MVEQIVVVATRDELHLAKELYPGADIRIMGVGINALCFLRDIPRTTKLINIGYAGGYMIPIGKRVTVSYCKMYHPNVEYPEPHYELEPLGDYPKVKCLTSSDFVNEYNGETEAVFDMELALICAMGFDVQCIKVISDNLNYDEYERNVETDKII